ncbi:unnamed protein product [Rotaria sordida]|uniref:Uncharacterized protein n=1 Tax=Rotaria sordida TaxID=392033 RepID=A0A819IKD3_9BILA|nr:unnamed protein product [Rotaria sordida]
MGLTPIVCIAQDYIQGKPANDLRLCKAILELPDNKTEHLPGYLPFVPGMLVLLTENIATELELSNGTGGIFRQLIYDEPPEDVRYHDQNFPPNTTVSVFGLIDTIFSRTIVYCLIPNGYYQEIGEYITAILFAAIGLFVTFRYSEIGLRVIAWISIIESVGIGIAILFLICTDFTGRHAQNSITKYSVTNQQDNSHAIPKRMGSFMCTIGHIIAFVFWVIIVKLTFKLAKLIGAKKAIAIQQIQRTV